MSRAVLFAAALLASGLSSATAQPRVHLIATGGTIAGGSGGSLGADELVELIPELSGIAEVSVEDFSSIGSSRMTPALQFDLARRVTRLFEERAELSGIVITHGTDSLEETAFFLDLLVPTGKPVVFAAAQRPPRETDTDGPRNLLNAIRIAASPEMRGMGVLVTLNDEIHAARDVRKTHAIAVEAFTSPWVGPLGRIDSGTIFLFHRPARRLSLRADEIEPRVEIVTLYTGSDGSQVRDAVEGGARGLVVDVFGRGNLPPKVMSAVRDARARGVVVVFTTRTGGGRVELGSDAESIGVVSGEDLDGLKARIVLVAALGESRELDRLRSHFRALAGAIPASSTSN